MAAMRRDVTDPEISGKESTDEMAMLRLDSAARFGGLRSGSGGAGAADGFAAGVRTRER
jgi:hypothetical protein